MDFGGIRIEDDIVVTENGYENLTQIGKERDEIERLMNSCLIFKSCYFLYLYTMSNSYRALTRKYRPQSFEDIVSQEHVSSTLLNAVQQNRLSHAYMFVALGEWGKLPWLGCWHV